MGCLVLDGDVYVLTISSHCFRCMDGSDDFVGIAFPCYCLFPSLARIFSLVAVCVLLCFLGDHILYSEHKQNKSSLSLSLSLTITGFQGDCGPASVRLGDHPKCQMCKLGDAYACDELCEMRSHHGKSEYAKFCKGLTLTSDTTSESWAQEENYDGLEGNVGGEGSMSRAFQFWMLATAASVVMAMVAVFMGQRRERREARGIGAGGAVLSGAVGRRHTAVSAFADGVLPSRVAGGVAAGAVGSAAAVEMSSYQLDDGGVNPDYPPEEEGVEQVMV